MGVIWLGKIKIHEIAKELELNSKEVIQRANELGINVTSHLSAVEEDVAQKIRDSFGKKQEKGKTNKEEKNTITDECLKQIVETFNVDVRREFLY